MKRKKNEEIKGKRKKERKNQKEKEKQETWFSNSCCKIEVESAKKSEKETIEKQERKKSKIMKMNEKIKLVLNNFFLKA